MPHWLEHVFGSAQVAVEAVLAGSAVVIGVLLPAAWVGRRRWAADSVEHSFDQPEDDDCALGIAEFASEVLSVETEIRVALGALGNFAGQQAVQLEIATERGLSTRMDPRVLQKVLRALVRHGIAQSSTRVLVSARRHGGRVQVEVTDDGQGAARVVQESRLRAPAQLVSLQGGTLEVRPRTGAGTTLVLRIPESTPAGEATSGSPSVGRSVVAASGRVDTLTRGAEVIIT